MNLRSVIVEAIFGIHVLIFLSFPLLFLVPSAVWSSRIEWHFYFVITLFVLFFLWGGIWTIKYRDRVYRICMLDTLMQRVRGYRLFDERNFRHSFVTELFERLGIMSNNLRQKIFPWLLFVCIILASILVVLKKFFGIILW